MAARTVLQLRFLRRAERYRRVDAQPSIRGRTDFFAAAATVTQVLGYGGATPFLADLSESLEAVNLLRAGQIDRGLLYAGGSIEANTAHFVHYEQCIVQQALERLRSRNPKSYAEQIRWANAALTFAMQAGLHWGWGACALFADAVRRCRPKLGRGIEFADQAHREVLGVEIARAHRNKIHGIPHSVFDRGCGGVPVRRFG